MRNKKSVKNNVPAKNSRSAQKFGETKAMPHEAICGKKPAFTGHGENEHFHPFSCGHVKR